MISLSTNPQLYSPQTAQVGRLAQVFASHLFELVFILQPYHATIILT